MDALQEWERRVAQDAAAGRLADVLEEVDADIAETGPLLGGEGYGS